MLDLSQQGQNFKMVPDTFKGIIMKFYKAN